MGYSIEEEDRVKQLFESIANQPIVEQRPYNEVRVAKPIVESTTFFEGTKVDLNKWSTDSKKVGKAKTASNPDLTKGNNNTDEIIKATKASSKQETENDTVTEKKEKGQVTKVVVEDNTAESKTAPKPKSGNFDAAAKSAEKASQSKAESNKKFSEESKNQRRAQILKGFMRSLAVDQKSKDAAEAVCTRIDKHFKIKTQKAKMEATDGAPGGKCTGNVVEDVNKAAIASSTANNESVRSIIDGLSFASKMGGDLTRRICGYLVPAVYEAHKDAITAFARECAKCGVTFNFKNIQLHALGGVPAIVVTVSCGQPANV